MEQEALKIGGGLLKKMPELKTKTEVMWREEGTGTIFMMLCALLKGNAIPTKNLILNRDEKTDKK